MMLRKTTVQPDEKFPVHEDNIIHKRVVTDNASLDTLEEGQNLADAAMNMPVKLEIWYTENENRDP